MQNITISNADRQVTSTDGSANQLTDIIMKRPHNLTPEPENTQQVYIYEEKGHWYAYGSSAQRISQVLKEHTKQAADAVIAAGTTAKDRVEVDFRVIINKFTIVLCSDSKMVLKCP